MHCRQGNKYGKPIKSATYFKNKKDDSNSIAVVVGNLKEVSKRLLEEVHSDSKREICACLSISEAAKVITAAISSWERFFNEQKIAAQK